MIYNSPQVFLHFNKYLQNDASRLSIFQTCFKINKLLVELFMIVIWYYSSYLLVEEQYTEQALGGHRVKDFDDIVTQPYPGVRRGKHPRHSDRRRWLGMICELGHLRRPWE